MLNVKNFGEQKFRYFAFIAYTHWGNGADYKYAKWFYRHIQSYTLPAKLAKKTKCKKLKPIFLDENDMRYKDYNIEDPGALKESKHLIILCSSRLKEHQDQVNKEITDFLAYGHTIEDVTPIVIEKGDWESYLPDAYRVERNRYKEKGIDPIVANIYDSEGKSNINSVLLRIIATINDIRPDELIKLDRRRKIIRAVMGFIACVAILFGIGCFTTARWDRFVEKAVNDDGIFHRLNLSDEYDRNASDIFNWNERQQKERLFNRLRTDYNNIVFTRRSGYFSLNKLKYDSKVVAASLKEETLVTALCEDGTVVTKNVSDGKTQYAVKMAESADNVFLSFWGTYIAVNDTTEKRVHFYTNNANLDIEKPIMTVPYSGESVDVAFDDSRDAQAYIITSENVIYCDVNFDLYNVCELHSEKQNGRLSCAYSDNGKRLAVICTDGSVHVYRITADNRVESERKISDGRNYVAVDLTRKNEYLILKTATGEIVRYDTASWQIVNSDLEGKLDLIANHVNYGDYVLSISGSQLEISKYAKKCYVRKVDKTSSYDERAYVSSHLTDNDIIYIMDNESDWINITKLGEYYNDNYIPISLEELGASDATYVISLTSSKKYMALTSREWLNFFEMRDSRTLELIKTVKTDSADDCQLDLENEFVVTASDEQICVYDYTGELLYTDSIKLDGCQFDQMALHDGKLLISYDNIQGVAQDLLNNLEISADALINELGTVVRFYDLKSRKLINEFFLEKRFVLDMRVPDFTMAVSDAYYKSEVIDANGNTVRKLPDSFVSDVGKYAYTPEWERVKLPDNTMQLELAMGSCFVLCKNKSGYSIVELDLNGERIVSSQLPIPPQSTDVNMNVFTNGAGVLITYVNSDSEVISYIYKSLSYNEIKGEIEKYLND